MIDLNKLLPEVFEELCKERIPLGLSDYLCAFQAVSDLVEADDIESIKIFCQLFWTKSYEDLQIFDEVFNMKVNALLRAEQEVQKENVLQADEQSSSSPRSKPPKPQHNLIQEQQQVKERSMRIPRLTPTKPRVSPQQTGASYREIKYHLVPRPPMDRRDMAGIWRQLRRPQRNGPLEELDVQATIDSISKNGFFLGPLLQARRRNQANLILLIDQGGSMTPFSLFITAFVESILRSGSLRQTSIFYFHDCPERYLYTYPNLLGARHIEDIFINDCQNNSVLIVSDAGAARGHFDLVRTQATKEFIQTLNQYTYLYAWLNPMPEARWAGTTAGDIAHLLPMFQLDREGLNDVVNILRGQPFQAEFGGYE